MTPTKIPLIVLALVVLLASIVYAGPLINQVYITPSYPSAYSQLNMYCNGSTNTTTNVSYEYIHFKNDVISSQASNANGCFVETANVSNSCYNGSGYYVITPTQYLNATNMYDGNLSSYARRDPTVGTVGWGVSYNKNVNITGAIVYVTHANKDLSNKSTEAYSLPYDCVNNSRTDIYYAFIFDGDTNIYPICYDESMTSFAFSPGYYDYPVFYEESISLLTNSTLSSGIYLNNLSTNLLYVNPPLTVGDEHIFSCRAYYNDAFSAWSNSTPVVVQGSILNNCSNATHALALNITVKNYTTVPSSANIEYSLNYYDSLYPSIGYNYNNSIGTVPQEQLCIFPNNTIAVTSGLITYSSNSIYYTYYMDTINLSNTTQTIYLMLDDDASDTLTLYVTEKSTDDEVAGAYISVQIYDVGSNTYTTTQILQTNDDGLAYANINLNTEYYRFIVTYNDEVVLITEPQRIISTTKQLVVSFAEQSWFTGYDMSLGVATSLTFNASGTNYFRFTADNSGGTAIESCLYVTHNGDFFNESCSTSVNSVILIPITIFTGNYYAVGKIYLNNEWYTRDDYNLVFESHEPAFRKDTTYITVFVSFLVILCLSFFGINHPTEALLLCALGLITVIALGWFNMSWSMLIAFIILVALNILAKRRAP